MLDPKATIALAKRGQQEKSIGRIARMRTRKQTAAHDQPFVTKLGVTHRRRRDVDVLFLRNKGFAEQEEDIGSAVATAPCRR